MEICHDYIQWLFPLRVESEFNEDAPVLTDEDVATFRQAFNCELEQYGPLARNYLVAIENFTNFLGIEAVGPGPYDFVLAKDFPERKYTWTQFNHNALRITRFLTSMSILGQEHYAQHLLAFMKHEAAEHHFAISDETMAYWDDALRGDDRRLR